MLKQRNAHIYGTLYPYISIRKLLSITRHGKLLNNNEL